jgi:hypothetical protein
MTEAIAYQYDGAVYCPDCMEDTSDEALEGIGNPLFPAHEPGLEHLAATAGEACGGACGQWLDPNWDWSPILGSEGTVKDWRWSTCVSCNTQRPHDHDSYQETRKAAWQGRGTCPNCLNGIERF